MHACGDLVTGGVFSISFNVCILQTGQGGTLWWHLRQQLLRCVLAPTPTPFARMPFLHTPFILRLVDSNLYLKLLPFFIFPSISLHSPSLSADVGGGLPS